MFYVPSNSLTHTHSCRHLGKENAVAQNDVSTLITRKRLTVCRSVCMLDSFVCCVASINILPFSLATAKAGYLWQGKDLRNYHKK